MSSRLRHARWSTLASNKNILSSYVFLFVSFILGSYHNLCYCVSASLRPCNFAMCICLAVGGVHGALSLPPLTSGIWSIICFLSILSVLGSYHITCYCVGASYRPCNFAMFNYLDTCSTHGALPLPLLVYYCQSRFFFPFISFPSRFHLQ